MTPSVDSRRAHRRVGLGRQAERRGPATIGLRVAIVERMRVLERYLVGLSAGLILFHYCFARSREWIWWPRVLKHAALWFAVAGTAAAVATWIKVRETRLAELLPYALAGVMLELAHEAERRQRERARAPDP